MANSKNLSAIIRRLRKPQRGGKISDALTYDYFSAIPEAIEALARGDNVQGGLNNRIRQGSTWFQFNVPTQTGSNSPGSTLGPLDVTIDASATPGTSVATVIPGTMNQLLPSNILTPPLNFDPTQPVTYVICTGTSDGQKITSVALSIGTTPPNPQIPASWGLPLTVDVAICVIVNSVPYRLIADGSIQLTGEQQFITSPSPPAQPGTPNYIPWYAWSVGSD